MSSLLSPHSITRLITISTYSIGHYKNGYGIFIMSPCQSFQPLCCSSAIRGFFSVLKAESITISLPFMSKKVCKTNTAKEPNKFDRYLRSLCHTSLNII